MMISFLEKFWMQRLKVEQTVRLQAYEPVRPN
jgi:hypothetical protein